MIELGPGHFRALTIQSDRIANRVVSPVKLEAAYDPATPPDPLPSQLDTKALWDTGATKSVITKATVDQLHLTPTGTAIVNHAGGSSQTNTYLVNFLLPPNVRVVGVMVTECPQTSGDFGAIIGMDVICKGDFSITNCDNRTCMSFRIPSISRIDYVQEANRINRGEYAKVGRNDPCPCGKRNSKGKRIKYKDCHGSPQGPRL